MANDLNHLMIIIYNIYLSLVLIERIGDKPQK